MFIRASAIAILALPLLAAATVITRTTTPTTPASQCRTGDLQCCDSTEESSEVTKLLQASLETIVGGDLSSLTGLVGLTCSPLTIIGGGSNSCTAHPVCCSNNSFHGLFALDCTPVDLDL